MKITRTLGFTAYHVYLHLALQEEVDTYESLHAKVKDQPELTEENATPPLIKLHYRLEQSRAKVILLAAACIEALANAYIGFRTSAQQFGVLERSTLIEKWVVVPSLFVSKYEFSKDGELYQDLKRVVDRRNAIVHLKPQITRKEEVIHEGSSPARAGDEPVFIGRCRTLPRRLLEHLASFDKGDEFSLLFGTLTFSWPSDAEMQKIEEEIKRLVESAPPNSA